jgi:uncharacterized radical SAM protein YgiQ
MTEDTKFIPEHPTNADERYDIVLVSGDAYVDHPSFGAAIIGRYLESLGYRVGIIAQPDWKSADAFKRFGKPRLFFGVTAGNLDSMVSNYTPKRKRREKDVYSPGGKPGLRPDMASVVYAQRCREAYPEATIIMGGIEASLRRMAHYDFVKQVVRPSVLALAKADFLIYGMGEKAIAALAWGLDAGRSNMELRTTPGVAYLAQAGEWSEGAVMLPSAEETIESPEKFLEMFQLADKALHEIQPPPLVQPHGNRFVVINSPAANLTPKELDALYQLPYARAYPAHYDKEGGIPALETVRFSVTTHRGCYGGCSFCALTAHQGRAVVSRPSKGIIQEVTRLAKHPEFRGTIQDMGGPTANMYGTRCTKAEPGQSGCTRPSCLTPQVCPHLEVSGADYLNLLRVARRVKGVKHVFTASGIRHDMVTLPPQRRLFRELLQHHVGGQMKVAPEHVTKRTLALMKKPPHSEMNEFMRLFNTTKVDLEKQIHFIPYLMVGHPGTNLEDALDLTRYVRKLGHFVEQVQVFTPTPMTASTCMYHTRTDPATGEEVYVPTATEAQVQRDLAQFQSPESRERLERYFKRIGRPELIKDIYQGRGRAGDRRDTRRGPKTPNPFRKDEGRSRGRSRAAAAVGKPPRSGGGGGRGR